MEEHIKMSEPDNVLKVYCDKQKVMIADLVAKVLMLETKLEILEAQRKNDIQKAFAREEELDDEPIPPKKTTSSRLQKVSENINMEKDSISTEDVRNDRKRSSQLR